LVDWRRTTYSLGTTVSDGTTTSAIQAVQVTIPDHVNLCLLNFIGIEVPKAAVRALIDVGAEIGSCRALR